MENIFSSETPWIFSKLNAKELSIARHGYGYKGSHAACLRRLTGAFTSFTAWPKPNSES
jgi:hypothetical protein